MNQFRYALIDLCGNQWIRECHLVWPHPTNGMEQWSRVVNNFHVYRGSRLSRAGERVLNSYDGLLFVVRSAGALATVCGLRKRFPLCKVVLVPGNSLFDIGPKLFDAMNGVDAVAATNVSERPIWESLAPGKYFWLGFPADFSVYVKHSRDHGLRDRNTVVLEDGPSILTIARMLQNVCGPIRFLVQPRCHGTEEIRQQFSMAGMACEVVQGKTWGEKLQETSEAWIAFAWNGDPAFQIDCAGQRIPCVGVDFGYQPLLFPDLSYHSIRGLSFALQHVKRFLETKGGPEYENVTTKAFKRAASLFHTDPCLTRFQAFESFLFMGAKAVRGPDD
ncbi:MAG TPA: hypothetical protein PLQ35_17715 [bacterium]|jgi:hypothetical protein|nr:hypothetical protein [bacterium]